MAAVPLMVGRLRDCSCLFNEGSLDTILGDVEMTTSEYVRGVLLGTFITLLLASFMLYAMTHIIPGDPIRALFGFRPPPPDVLAELRGQYGLDDPFYIQYFKFLKNASGLEFGFSTRGPAVRDLVLAGIPVSLRLASLALVFQIVVGVGLGLAAALTRRRGSRWLVGAATLMILAIPVFVVAYLLQTYVGFELQWLPIRGVSQGWTSYLLPALALAAGATALTIRMTTNEVRATQAQPFVTAARAKGLSHRRVMIVHVLRVSLVPIITFIAASAAQIIGGLIIVEAIFEMPGIGAAVLDAIRAKDHNVIVAILCVAVLFSIAANATADLLYPVIDPRIKR